MIFMRTRKLFTTLMMLWAAVIMGQSVKLKGRVLDSSGLVMPGPRIKDYQGETVVAQGTAGPTGDFELPVDSGSYRLGKTPAGSPPNTVHAEAPPTIAPLPRSFHSAPIAPRR